MRRLLIAGVVAALGAALTGFPQPVSAAPGGPDGFATVPGHAVASDNPPTRYTT